MNLMEVVGLFSTLTSKTAYPLEFPYETVREDIIVVDIINGNRVASVIEQNVQIMTRSSHPSTAEAMGQSIIDTLHNYCNGTSGDWEVILIQATNPNPFFTGKDKTGKYVYTSDFRLLVSK